MSIFTSLLITPWRVCTEIVSNDAEKRTILKKFESKKEFVVLIVSTKEVQDKGEIVVFNDEGKLGSIPITDCKDKLSEELSKKNDIEKKIVRLFTSHLDRTLKSGWCLCEKLVSDNEEKQKIQNEFESKKKECAVLIVKTKSEPDKLSIAGFNDEGQFKSVLIKDSNYELSKKNELPKELEKKIVEELNKKIIIEKKIVELVASKLDHTLKLQNQGLVFVGFDGVCPDGRYQSLKKNGHSLFTAKIAVVKICKYMVELIYDDMEKSQKAKPDNKDRKKKLSAKKIKDKHIVEYDAEVKRFIP